ncbi:MAG: ABC transporter ATP-binding protein [Acidobacteriota bacterium]|nr:ABC transporter ATP-binding protein [Acidobacteriota bacterium]
MTAVIEVDGLTKLYRRSAPGYQLRTLKSALLERSLTAGLKPEDTIQAIEEVNFAVQEGEAFAVIGSNGSGKSTLLKILAGILKPTAGHVRIRGRVAALIELGAGFHPEISGRENVYINGAVLGLPRREVERRFDEIVEFSGLADFIDEPVKNYSSGMYVRLGFSVAIHTDPDILLVDEVLAVGDEAFAHKCVRKIEEFLAKGRTVLLVSHSLGLVEEFADRCLWLDRGRQRLLAEPRRVADAYRQAVAESEGHQHKEAKKQRQEQIESLDSAGEVVSDAVAEDQPVAEEPEEVLRWGSREAEIMSARMLDLLGNERYNFSTGDGVVFEIRARADRALEDFVFGVGLFTFRGVEVWGTNTHLAGMRPKTFSGDATVRLQCPELRLAPGEYLLDVAVHARDGYPYDYHRQILSFSLISSETGVGVYFPRHEWQSEGGVNWGEPVRQ